MCAHARADRPTKQKTPLALTPCRYQGCHDLPGVTSNNRVGNHFVFFVYIDKVALDSSMGSFDPISIAFAHKHTSYDKS